MTATDALSVLTQPLVVGLLVVVGLLLLGIELAVLPGFGAAGVSGAVALVAGGVLALAGAGTAAAAVERASVLLATVVVVTIGGGALVLRRVPAARLRPGLVLRDRVAGARRSTLPEGRRDSLRGARGVALSDLRPAGYVRLDGTAGAPGTSRVDVVTAGEHIGAGEPVEVVADDGYRRVVRRVPPASRPATAGPAT